MNTLGERIKHLRTLHKLSLAQLGEICGVSAQAVYGWESGTTENIKLPQFLKLCAHFSIDPYVLVFPDEKQRPRPSSSSGRFRKFPHSS